MPFDSFIPIHSAFGLPVYVAASQLAPFDRLKALSLPMGSEPRAAPMRSFLCL
jgi:hypothetical protein